MKKQVIYDWNGMLQREIDWDLRIPIPEIEADWNSERRHRFLFREDVTTPISVDRLVWRRCEPNDELRDNKCLAVTITTMTNLAANDRSDIEYKSQNATSFAGFDVASSSRVSMLMNCAFKESELQLKDDWKPRLNSFHLFSDYGDARDFSKFSDLVWAPEHSESVVFGIWLWIDIPQNLSSPSHSN